VCGQGQSRATPPSAPGARSRARQRSAIGSPSSPTCPCSWTRPPTR
jgi:hypothetical protein